MLLRTIEIPKFIINVQLSKKRRTVYYKAKDNLPKKYKKCKIKKGYYVDENGERLIKNPRVAGKPKVLKLAGNDFYTGYQHPSVRAKVVRELKAFYRPFIQENIRQFGAIETFPLNVEWDVYTDVSNPNWDASNLGFYYKYFEDCLFESKNYDGSPILYKREPVKQLIPDDNIVFITFPPGPKIIPVDNWEDRKFVFRFYYDDREELKRTPWTN